MSKYVGFRRGKYWERAENSDYYCGGCGYPVTDHDSYCPECGGAFRECDASNLEEENAKLREQIEHLQPTDCEGNVLDIADTVHMLRSEYDGDHEWDDVVVELVLTKWGGDRWIVRGSRGEAWACDCAKTGYDEDAYENSYDAEPIEKPTLFEVENAKLRELAEKAWKAAEMLCQAWDGPCHADGVSIKPPCPLDERDELCVYGLIQRDLRELGVEVP